MSRLSRRHAEIRRLLHDHMSASVADLSDWLSVSAETVRRDLRLMAERGEILKMHGAAALPHAVGEAPFERRMRENALGKRAIARRAAQAIEDGDSIIGIETVRERQERPDRRLGRRGVVPPEPVPELAVHSALSPHPQDPQAPRPREDPSKLSCRSPLP